MNPVKLCIQNGHRNVQNGQTGTSGITSSGVKLSEVDFIDKVYYAIKSIIDGNTSFSSKIQLSYDDASVVNGQTADYFIAIHADGATNSLYDGGFVDNSPDDQVSALSWAFATEVANNYFSLIGIRFVPEHRTSNSTYYYAFNLTGAKTKQFIIECGAMTNMHDMDILINTQKVGELIWNGILSYFGKVESLFQSTPPPPPTQPSTATDPCADLKQQLNDATKAIVTLNTNYANLQIEKDQELADQEKLCQQKLQAQLSQLSFKDLLTGLLKKLRG